MSRRIGAMPQLVQATMRSRGTNFDTSPITCCDVLGRLDLVAGDVDDADQHVLAVEQRRAASSARCELMAFERHLLDAALGERREDLLVLAPLAAQRRLPVDVGLDAVAVADVHGGGAGEPVDRALQRLDAPVRSPRP